MALKFWNGSSGSGKSTQLDSFIINESIAHPELNYLIIVPEQFTLQTQQDIVRMHPRKGILNIDILSFNRLAHRIFEETGYGADGGKTIDDMGKNLVLRRVAQLHKAELSMLGDNLDKLGYITQVKSAISEYMQYGIDEEKAFKLAEDAKEGHKGQLSCKLKDIALLYSQFLAYIKDNYTTREELMIRLSNVLPKSSMIRNCIVAFDGFTGFTPVQLTVIENLLMLCKDVHVAITIDKRQDNVIFEEHELFYLAKKTTKQLGKIADRCGINQLADNNITDPVPIRYKECGAKMLPHLESNLFRPECKPYEGDNTGEIHIQYGLNPDEEMELNALRICKLIAEKGYKYRDIAIITGDIEIYRSSIERALIRHDIPYFTDKVQPILLNPMIEMLRSAILVEADNYSYEAVFRFLKTGLTDIESDDIDELENYCIATGVKGRKAWRSTFARLPRVYSSLSSTEKAKYLERINSLRKAVNAIFENLEADIADNFNGRTHESIVVYSKAFYKMLERNDVKSKLEKRVEEFKSQGRDNEAKIYDQIFARVMQVFEQMCDLLGSEKISIRQFGQLMDAGLDEIRIGTVPKNTDYVQIGDLTRSRLHDIKVLFVVGCNDGIIPPALSSGGIISDSDKLFLMDNNDSLVFAPTARESVYTQRLYLYMMLTKPSERLYFSYSKINASGESVRPSYIIKTIHDMFSCVKIQSIPLGLQDRVSDKKGSFSLIPEILNEYVSGNYDYEDVYENLIRYYAQDDEYNSRIMSIVEKNIERMASNADDRGEKDATKNTTGLISRAVARALYGTNIISSVTRLEMYANCAYQYFLEYGLKLNEREVFSFEVTDLGSVFHSSLEEYANSLKKNGQNWINVSDEDSEKAIDEAVERAVAKDEMAALYSTRRTAHMVKRIKRIMRRTVDVLRYQAGKGVFTPHDIEVDFNRLEDIDALNLKLSDDESIRLTGRIDRVDTYEEGGKTYVRIIDYKSGNKKLDLAAVYEGRELQLVVYLDAAMGMIKKTTSNEVVPAGILYYHIDDPMIKDSEIKDISEIEKVIRKKLKMTGYVNSDRSIIELMHENIEGNSDVIPAGFKNDGTLYKDSKVLSSAEFEELSSGAREAMTNMGQRIMHGDIMTAKERGDIKKYPDTCKYCPVKAICNQKTDVINSETDEESAEGGEE